MSTDGPSGGPAPVQAPSSSRPAAPPAPGAPASQPAAGRGSGGDGRGGPAPGRGGGRGGRGAGAQQHQIQCVNPQCKVNLSFPAGSTAVQCSVCKTTMNVLIQTHCKSCSTSLLLPVNTTVAQCPRCNSVFNLNPPNQQRDRPSTAQDQARRARQAEEEMVRRAIRMSLKERGLTAEQIERLPSFKHTGEGHGGENTECTVCFEEYAKDEVLILLPCTHQFHKSCLVGWLKAQRQCPLCKTDVFTGQGEPGEDPNSP